ncbi:MAG: Type III restriction-modification system methylation subunit [Candidatus Woesebacteria bacterium]|nr:MAG: Type III restriction-modification system methylation subunit [Candidatus Woesebacteria bacterium]
MAKKMSDNNNQVAVDKTELVWPGKRREVERVELPFQTIETINLPRGRRQESIFEAIQKQQSLISQPEQQILRSEEGEWKNRLIWGDNLLVMGSLIKEFAGKINLIYIDPPFATGDDFSFTVNIGDQAEITKEPSALEVKAYRDTWGKGMQSYLQMMYDRLVLMKELLADNGSIYVHLDWHVGHYVKILMDEIFGRDNFRNEIVWRYGKMAASSKKFLSNHDVILFYTKSYNFTFNQQFIALDKPIKRLARTVRDGKLVNVKDEKGNLVYVEKSDRIVDDVWDDISTVMHASPQFLNFPTQKPQLLLERIIKTSSNEGDLVADFFCGSGTTGVVAEKLGRRWIMCDLGRFAIHTTRKRLLDMGAKPFVVQNLGKYERHRWVQLNGRYKDYIKFILELYHAEPVEGFTNLHGKKGSSFVRVGSVDAPVTLSEIREALEECKENNIRKLDVLGWEWEMGLHDLVKEEAEKYGVKLVTLQIPREVMDISPAEAKKHDIQFFELAYLEVEPKVEGRHVTITLKDFIIPNPELLPEEIKGKVKSWSDFIDYWAVDWMFNQHEEVTEEDDTFHNMNQHYRTRKEPKLELSMGYEYKNAGKYNVLVKVIDIFGNDTTKLIQIKV